MTPPLAGFRAGTAGRSKSEAYGLDLLARLGADLEAETGAPAVSGATEAPAWGRAGAEASGTPGSATISIRGAGHRADARLHPLDSRLAAWAGSGLAASAASGLPPGVTDLALGRALAAAALAGWLAGRDINVEPLAVLMQLHLPAVMAASYGSPWWPQPPAPRPAPAGGWLNADLGAPGDEESFARLLETFGPDASAAAIAAEAQAWRLPVCDYRSPAPDGRPPWRPPPGDDPAPDAHPGSGRLRPRPSPPPGRPALAGITVCDLTSMWAGPLATWLLAQLGASIIKVEPPSRPDGTRALSGRGVWPGGRARGPAGEDSALYNALNSNKRSVRLDAAQDAAELRDLAASADVVIDSFSPRVMPQLGLDRGPLGLDRPGHGGPGTVTLSMPAFPPGPAREWVAYGNGIHALSGLGGDGGRADAAPAVPVSSYPDPLAGLEAAATVVAALAGRKAGWLPQHLEVSLAGTVEPLLSEPPGAWTRTEDSLGGRLLAAAWRSGVAEARRDGAGVHLYPGGPFR